MATRARHVRAPFVVALGALLAVLAIRSHAGEPDEPAVDLPAVGTLGVVPTGTDAIVVRVRADGRVSIEGKGGLSLAAVEQEVARRGGEGGPCNEDGSSRKALVLEADRALPWVVSVWIVKAALRARPWPRTLFFVARARDGKRGAIGWCLPGGEQRSSATLPFTAAVLDLGEGEAADPDTLVPYLLDARRCADDSGETRLDVLGPRSGSPAVSTGFVLRVFDLALRAGVTDVTFEGERLPEEEDREDAAWLLRRTAELRREGGATRLRLLGREPGTGSTLGDLAPPQGLLPHAYGLDVVSPGRPARAEHRGRPSLYRLAREAGEHGLEWLAARQLPDGRWEAETPGHDVAATALALEAFLRHGYTNRGRHAYAMLVSKGLRFLKDRQREQEDGRFVAETAGHASYVHAAATLAMAEAYERTGSPIFKGSLKAGLDAIADLRSSAGLWSKRSEDPRLDVWLALPVATVAAINRGYEQRGRKPALALDEATLAAVRGWVARQGAEVSALPLPVRAGVTRLRVLFGEDVDESESLREAREHHGRRHPQVDECDVVDLALGLDAFRPPDDMRYGSWTAWAGWHEVALVLLTRQRWDGDEDGQRGSWDPCGGEVFGGGRVVSTALVTRSLAPYGHVHWVQIQPQWRFGD